MAVFAVLTLAGGCNAPAPTTEPASSPNAARDCGSEDVGRDGGFNVEGRRCLLDAYIAGGAAVFVSRMTTVEGDPIVREYRVQPDRSVDIVHDARRDRFGSGQIERLQCSALIAVEDYNAQTGAGLPPEYVFVEDGCAERS